MPVNCRNATKKAAIIASAILTQPGFVPKSSPGKLPQGQASGRGKICRREQKSDIHSFEKPFFLHGSDMFIATAFYKGRKSIPHLLRKNKGLRPVFFAKKQEKWAKNEKAPGQNPEADGTYSTE